MAPGSIEKYRKQVLEFLDETFDSHHGIYLDKGTSLFATLASVSAEEASSRAGERNATPAAHVRHVILYLRVMQKDIRGEEVGEVKWREIWENDGPTTPAEWTKLLAELRAEHTELVRLMNDPATLEREDGLGGCMAIVAHTAYHLGAIRHGLLAIRYGGPGPTVEQGSQAKR